MTSKDLITHRLLNQHIAGATFKSAEEIVAYLGAIQSQDWHMAKWAIGLRLPGSKEADIEKAFNEGKILRTHVMRPTWHFVSPADIKWMQDLTSRRVHAFNANYYRKHGLDQKIFKKCNAILTKSLRDHHYMTRNELNELFKKAKMHMDTIQLSYIMMNAELESLICSGPRKGKQFTYALLDEKVPPSSPISKEEALHKLTSVYFKTRGPATLYDFSWWSGLTVKEAKEGIATLSKNFITEKMNDNEYIYFDQPLKDISKLQITFLVPDYDEYGISYKDRSIYDHPKMIKAGNVSSTYYIHAIVVDGFMGGQWGRPTDKNKSTIEISPFKGLTKKQLNSIDKAVKMYSTFFT